MTTNFQFAWLYMRDSGDEVHLEVCGTSAIMTHNKVRAVYRALCNRAAYLILRQQGAEPPSREESAWAHQYVNTLPECDLLWIGVKRKGARVAGYPQELQGEREDSGIHDKQAVQ